MIEKSITEFLSVEYKEFAMYSIEGRAIPSVIDGFKPTHRKVIHVCNQIWKNGSEKPLKVFQLAGKVASDAFYHHGNTSLENAIVTMAQKFKILTLGTRQLLWRYDEDSLRQILQAYNFNNVFLLQVGETTISRPEPLDLSERSEESIYIEATKL